MRGSQEIALRYSKALFEKAETDTQREHLLKEMQALLALFNQVPKLKALFYFSGLSVEEKQHLLDKGFKGKIDPVLFLFLELLLKKRRFSSFPSIVERYNQRVKEQQRILDAEVKTAIPFPQIHKEQLIAKLEKAFGKDVNLEETVDPSLEGGGMLLAANYIIDSTIKNRLNLLKQKLLSL